jgi:transcriptional regulator with XRE-family HTH domain
VTIDISDIAAELRLARQRAGLSQQAFARRQGLPQSQISRAERGEDIRLSTLRELARGLGLEVVLVPVHRLGAVAASLRVDDQTQEAPARFAASAERDPE